MQCRECDYPLWNLKTRTCPECGTVFDVEDFEFVPNSVQFCCANCDQAYYGTSSRGLIVPTEFTCVKCGQHVRLSEMVLRPASGVPEESTQVTRVWWHERHRIGFLKAWLKTIGQVIAQPGRLAVAVRDANRPAQAWMFGVVTAFVYGFLGILMAGVLGGLFSLSGGQGSYALFSSIAGAAAWMAGTLVVTLVGVTLWALVTHLIMRIGSRKPRALNQTFEVILYGGAVNFLWAIPLFGPICTWWGGVIWWIVVVTVMMYHVHGVSGLKTTLATLTFPMIVMLSLVAAYVGLMIAVTTQMNTAITAASFNNSTSVSSAIFSHAALNNGRPPTHVLELVADSSLSAEELISWTSATRVTDISVGDGTLLDFQDATADRQTELINAVKQSMPSNLVAYRMGDYVFTYPGMNFQQAPNPGLWIFVVCDDPDSAGGARSITPIEVVTVNGNTLRVQLARWPSYLAAQNTLRQANGLPPLPDPLTIRQSAPAIDAKSNAERDGG